MFINFGDIPGHQNLFLDYLYEFENVKEFYENDFRNKDEYLNKFKKITGTERSFRDNLPDIILKQYKNLEPSQKTKDNITSLNSKHTLAVVTGQQLGILGGPLYTFYKIITAIKLAASLSGKYADFNFIPVFWLEGDDHDVEEVSHINLVNDNNELMKLNYGEINPDEEIKVSVGNIKFDDAINSFFDELDKNLRNTEFKDNLMSKLKSIYSEGKTYRESFSELIFWLFDEYGLVLFNPQDIEIKTLLKPIFKKEINEFRTHTEKLVNVSAKLEETYHAQVKVKPINLFYGNEEGRFSIEPMDDGGYRLKRKKKKFTNEEIISEIENNPQNFSPNVLLRPICQDYILPTAFYIGGPSEIAYFAQVTKLYNLFNLETPFIYPRSSATIIEKNINSILEKYNLSVEDIFTDIEKLKLKVVESISSTTMEDVFGKTQHEIDLALDNLKEKLFVIDKTIADSTSKYRDKIFHYLNELKDKSKESQSKKHEITLRQIDKAAVALFPNSNLQEREINFIYFANKYGIDFLKKIFEEIEINKFEHQTLKL